MTVPYFALFDPDEEELDEEEDDDEDEDEDDEEDEDDVEVLEDDELDEEEDGIKIRPEPPHAEQGKLWVCGIVAY